MLGPLSLPCNSDHLYRLLGPASCRQKRVRGLGGYLFWLRVEIRAREMQQNSVVSLL
jgi:hypothetical protein